MLRRSVAKPWINRSLLASTATATLWPQQRWASWRRGTAPSIAVHSYESMLHHRCFSTTMPIYQAKVQAAPGKGAAPPLWTPEVKDVNDKLLPAIRNFGIVAHIDAGKTTTTERMLFYSGSVRRIGEVDSGTTTTDYLEEERERGVTITAAAVTFLWKGHQVNLIDTPGHVDFTVEVERSLRVLDGVVALFDAAVGVEAQSYTVLRQARRHKIPLIAYINKMDKSNADFNLAVNSIRKKLHVEPLLVQVPLLENDGSFSGIVDLVKGIAIRFEGKDGETVVERSIESQQHHVREAFQQGRHELLAALSSRDDVMAEALIVLLDQFGGDEAKAEAGIDEKTLRETIRRQTLKSMVQDEVPLVPVLCGASRRNMGVQTLMDAVVSYLPSPLERPVVVGRNTVNESTPLPHPPSCEVSNNFIALAFKVIHIPHPQTRENRGLVFFRCYSGRISNKQEFVNTTTGKTEKIDQLYVMHANVPVQVNSVGAGQIGAAFVKEASTGETLFREGTSALTIRSKDPALYEQMKAQRCATLEGIDIPQPVVSFSLEPASAAQTKMTEQALTCLNREDPSFQWRTNDHGQLIVQGMGELHLEIICSRLKSQYQLDTQLARAIIEYRESVRDRSKLENYVIEHNGTPLFAISLELEPVREADNADANDGSATPSSSSAAEEVDMERIPVSNTVRWIWTAEAKKQMLDRISAASQKVAATEGGSQTLGRHQKKAAEDMKYIDGLFERALLERVSTMGPLASLRLVGIAVRVTDLRLLNPGVVGINFAIQCDKALEELCRRNPRKVLAEPMMEIEVHLSEPKYLGEVIRDLSEREPAAVETLEDNRSIRATVPLRCITRYVTHLRKAAKGNAYYFANLAYFKEVSKAEVRQKILSELR